MSTTSHLDGSEIVLVFDFLPMIQQAHTKLVVTNANSTKSRVIRPVSIPIIVMLKCIFLVSGILFVVSNVLGLTVLVIRLLTDVNEVTVDVSDVVVGVCSVLI